MKFCSSCGKELAETAAFCDGCGTKTSGNTAVAVMEKPESVATQTMGTNELTSNQEREQVLSQLMVCYDAILAIGVAHDELEQNRKKLPLLHKQLDDIQLKITSCEELKSRDSNLTEMRNKVVLMKKSTTLVSILALITFISLVGGMPLSLFIGILLEGMDGDGDIIQSLALLFVIAIPCILFLSIKIIEMKHPYSVKDVINLEKEIKDIEDAVSNFKIYKDEIAQAESKLIKQKEVINLLEQTLQSICEEESSRFMMEYLPKDYCNLDAVSCFISYLENKRADTFKEAINVYEDEKHKSEMREMQKISMNKLNHQANMIHEQSKMMVMSIEQQAKWQQENAARQERMIANSQKINEEIRFGNAVSVINLVDRWEQEGRLKK